MARYKYRCRKCKADEEIEHSIQESPVIKYKCGELKVRVMGRPTMWMNGKQIITELKAGERGDLKDDFSQQCYDGSKHGQSWSDFKNEECKKGTLSGYDKKGKRTQ